MLLLLRHQPSNPSQNYSLLYFRSWLSWTVHLFYFLEASNQLWGFPCSLSYDVEATSKFLGLHFIQFWFLTALSLEVISCFAGVYPIHPIKSNIVCSRKEAQVTSFLSPCPPICVPSGHTYTPGDHWCHQGPVFAVMASLCVAQVPSAPINLAMKPQGKSWSQLPR